MIILDTHVLVWALTDDRKLGRKARTLIEKHWANAKLAVAAISFWEIGQLQSRRRLQLHAPVREWRNELLTAGIIELVLDGDIALRAIELNGLAEDPADRFIVATALTHQAVLLTADEKLLDWRHSLECHDART